MFVRENVLKLAVSKYYAMDRLTGEIITVGQISLPKDNGTLLGDWCIYDSLGYWDRSATIDLETEIISDELGNTYEVVECIYDEIEEWTDDNFSDFQLFGTQMIETAGRYTRKTVKQGDKAICEIYCTLPSGSIMYFDGRRAQYINDNHEWKLVSIS